MNTVLLIVLTMLLQQRPQPPKNDPTGVWQSDTGTKFDMKLTGTEIKVHLVEGSNPVYLKYDIDLKNTGEVNTYAGKGSFVAKVKEQECKFPTDWSIAVVAPEQIAGYMSRIVPKPGTCEVQDETSEFVQLKKVK
jgi:hypothetical protein